MARPKVTWGRAVSTTRGGTAAQSLMSGAVMPLGQVATGTRVMIEELEYEVTKIDRAEDGEVTLTCGLVKATPRPRRGRK